MKAATTYIILTFLIFASCTQNTFIVVDDNYDKNKPELLDQISFFSRIVDYGYAASTGYTLFPEGNYAQLSIFVNDGDCILSGADYKAFQAGVLTAVSEEIIKIPSDIYDFYLISCNDSSSDFPTFSGGEATDIENGYDYLWYHITFDVVMAQTNIPVNFQHVCSQIAITVVSGDTLLNAEWINYAQMGEPDITSDVYWDFYSGEIVPATSFKAGTGLNLPASALTCQQYIVPVSGVAEVPGFVQMKLKNVTDLLDYDFTIPIPDSTFKAGTSYQYTLKLDIDTVYIDEVVIGPWIDVSEGTIGPDIQNLD